MEYEFILNNYAHESYRALSIVPKGFDVNDSKKASSFLDKYWLTNSEYEHAVRHIERKMFITNGTGLPSMLISPNYEILAMSGGVVFNEEEFLYLQKYLKAVGEEYFYIIEEVENKDFIPIRLKFPSNITWEELSSGSYISMILLHYMFGTFKLLGSSGLWGRYSDNHWSTDIWCFKNLDSNELTTYLKKEMINDEPFVKETLSTQYTDRIKW